MLLKTFRQISEPRGTTNLTELETPIEEEPGLDSHIRFQLSETDKLIVDRKVSKQS